MNNPSPASHQDWRLPTAAAFFGSMVLTLVALHFNPILGRDSAFYVDLAHLYLDSGIDGLSERYDWPWLPVMIGWLHQITGMSPIASSHLLMTLLMAGCCAVLTRTTALLRPQAVWWGCLVALSLPAFNSYRESILREPGYWLFSALTLQFVLRWHQDRAVRDLAVAMVFIGLAMAFRLEAIFLVAALCLSFAWHNRALLRTYQKGVVVASAVALGTAVLLAGLVIALAGTNARVGYYLQLLSPAELFASFDLTAQRFAEAALMHYSYGDAGLILFTGFLAVILVKAFLMCGPFLLVLGTKPAEQSRKDFAPVMPMLVSALGLYLIVLMIFFMQHSFMIDRYVALAHVLAAPVIALAAQDFARRFRRIGYLLIVLAGLVAVANVVSLSDKRTHYLDAADWIRANLPLEASVYYDDQRVSFYAGRGYNAAASAQTLAPDQDILELDYLVLDGGRDDSRILGLIESGRAEVVATFRNEGHRELSILRVAQ